MLPLAPLTLLALLLPALAQPTPLALPLFPSSSSLPSVPSNYFGLSIELSSLSALLGPGGPDASTIPAPLTNYLSAISARLSPAGAVPLRVRIGGNSMDDSVYAANQTASLLQVLDPDANANDVPVSFGPLLFTTLTTLVQPARALNLSYTLGISLRTPNDTSSYVPLAQAAVAQLPAQALDLLLLGNEPDLYYDHGDRPGLANYTVADYMGDFEQEIAGMGSVADRPILGGPTICCEWDLAALLAASYIPAFPALRAITLQHYPQNNCFGTYAFGLPYYLSHGNVVALAAWQADGVALARQQGREVRMTEFNSASCGGVPGISDTFAATLWTLDYALQLATVGYTSASIHTREPGVSYNVFSPPIPATSTDASPNSNWTTGVTYWPLLVLAEALAPDAPDADAAGAGYTAVVDLALPDDTAGAYALYASGLGWQLARLVLINYSSTNATYSVPANLTSLFPASSPFAASGAAPTVQLRTKLLLAPETDVSDPPISWAGQAMSEQGDGTLVGGVVVTSSVCDAGTAQSGGCDVVVPGPGAAVVFLNITAGGSGASGGATGSASTTTGGAGPTSLASTSAARGLQVPLIVLLAFLLSCAVGLAL